MNFEKKLCGSCPNHQISEQLLIQYFYKGLSPMDRNMIDAASGGALVDKTPIEAKRLIANMASNSQYCNRGNTSMSQQVKETNIAELKMQVSNLTALVERVVGEKIPAKLCGICSFTGHPTDMCPTLQEEEQVNAIGGQPLQKGIIHLPQHSILDGRIIRI